MRNILEPFIFSSVIPASFIQIVPKTLGWYQINPTTSVESADNSIAIKLISIGF
ncbi:hypothetical protein [Flavobacterium sp.]|uniref:hypothetical protein n=1 Tax=Flavobacterium sp. TaxID=239 RepID=UPI0038FCE5B0